MWLVFRIMLRGAREVSWRLLFLAMWLWCVRGGFFALRAWRKRLKRGEHFPPFCFFAITGKCPLRCAGCWVDDRNEITPELLDAAIKSAATQAVYFHTLLGGEPLLYPDLWQLIARNQKCYFQIITSGQTLDANAADEIRKLGNVTPLISIDGFEQVNDVRRGVGTFAKAISACETLQQKRILYGIACVVTSENLEEVVTPDFVQRFIDLGAMYLWFYVFRPVGASPSPQLALSAAQLITLRTRLLQLRRQMPIILIDTYWDANGRAVCPAARGMGYHIGPSGGIEPCPPLSVCCEKIGEHNGDIAQTIRASKFLPTFGNFVREQFSPERQGCVILSHPQKLGAFFRTQGVIDTSGRDLLAELERAPILASHHQPEHELREDFWFYRLLKKMLFFGMGAYG